MIGLGLASSHAPSMFRPVDTWPALHRTLTGNVPQPLELGQETLEVLQQHKKRIDAGFSVLAEQLDAYGPDALIVVGDDQGEVFSAANMPSFCLFTCPEVHGTLNVSLIGEPEEENHITMRCHPTLARYLLDGLIEKGFDLSHSDELRPLGKPKRGMGHAFTRPVLKVMPRANVPVVNLHVNAYFPPLPSAARCYAIGRAIAALLENRPEKVAIMASGGLSHDPRGPRAGWIDTALDRWVLKQLESGNDQALCDLFRFDSDALAGGTGEIRSWIVVAGACRKARATIVDYIPAHHAVTGIGFAYWDPAEIERSRRNFEEHGGRQTQ